MTSLAAIYLPIAKKSGIPHTIAHVRSGGVSAGLKGLATKWMRRDLPKKADILLTCAMDAGVAVYGKKAERDGRIRVVPNAIDTEAFRFSAEDRKQIRAELGIPEDAFVIGHVGRFDPMKNHAFLAAVLRALYEGGARHTLYTHSNHKMSVRFLRQYGLDRWFDGWVTPDDPGFAMKPDPGAIRYILEHRHIDPADAVMVGDREIDMRCARDAGVDGILVDPDRLVAETCARYRADDLMEIIL